MANKGGIRIAIAGVGNCASSLIQGLYYYTPERCGEGVVGLMHTEIGGVVKDEKMEVKQWKHFRQ